MAKEKLVKIQLVKSVIGIPAKHRRIVKALGLRKRESQLVKKDNPAISGMIFKIKHLLKIERFEE